jgi:amidase
MNLEGSDVLQSDATAALASLREGHISSQELLRLCFERIDQARESINAVVVDRREEALADARAADAARARGDDRPLLGLPVTLKEAFDVAGLPTTWGLPEYAATLKEEDSEVAHSLRDAGAVILGKTNVPVMLATYHSQNPVYGRTFNPYDRSRTPGGSSGGAAAALAASHTFLECGSDLGGSIRQPADSCGVFGIKPTWGLISQRGHVPPMVPHHLAGFVDSPATGQLAAVGPMARSARDLELALGILARPTGPASRAFSLQLPAPRGNALADFRVGYVLDHRSAPVDSVVGTMHRRLIESLRLAGMDLKEGWPEGVDPDHMRDLRFYLRAGMDVFIPPEEIAARVERGLAGPEFPSGDFQALLDRGLADNLPARVTREFERDRYRKTWDDYFSRVDVFLMPVQTHTAFARNEIDEATTFADHLWWAPATLLGTPAVVAPVGVADDGLPVGIQIMGAQYDDATPIAFARALENSGLAGFVPPTK